MTSILNKQDGDFFKDPENFERMPEMYETDEESTSEEHQYTYSNYFEPNRSKSDYETCKERLAARIRAMENKALSDQPWQLKGEVTAKSRPENSLIEEALEFDSNVAPVPTITMETTQSIEAIIIQRIKDESYDDVVSKTRLQNDGEKFKTRPDLNHEKSKMSLSAIYEQEYLALRDKEDGSEEKIDPAEEETRKMMSSLFAKLDALSRFEYTPKPVLKEMKVISHLPSLVVEEVQPDTVADSARLAPEEIKKRKIEVKSFSEFSKEDTKRLRRQKRAKRRKSERMNRTTKAGIQRINSGLGLQPTSQ